MILCVNVEMDTYLIIGIEFYTQARTLNIMLHAKGNVQYVELENLLSWSMEMKQIYIQ